MKLEKGESDIVRPLGIIQAVVAEHVDLGKVPDKFNEGKMKHEVAVIWQLAETFKNSEGKDERLVQSQIFRASINVKSSLYKIITGGLGLKKIQVGTFDLDSLTGKNMMLNIQAKEDSEYTTISSAAPLMKGLAAIKVENYTRPKWVDKMIADRKTDAEANSAAEKFRGEANATVKEKDLSEIAASL